MKNVFTPQDVEQDPILQAKEVAQWLEVEPDKIAAWKRKGRLPRYEFGLPKKAKSWRLSTLLNHDAFEGCFPEKKKAEIAFLKSISQKKPRLIFSKESSESLLRHCMLFSPRIRRGIKHGHFSQKCLTWDCCMKQKNSRGRGHERVYNSGGH